MLTPLMGNDDGKGRHIPERRQAACRTRVIAVLASRFGERGRQRVFHTMVNTRGVFATPNRDRGLPWCRSDEHSRRLFAGFVPPLLGAPPPITPTTGEAISEQDDPRLWSSGRRTAAAYTVPIVIRVVAPLLLALAGCAGERGCPLMKRVIKTRFEEKRQLRNIQQLQLLSGSASSRKTHQFPRPFALLLGPTKPETLSRRSPRTLPREVPTLLTPETAP